MAWAEKLLTRRRAADPAAPVWVMPHSAYMLSREQLERIMALAARFDARVHVHAAESPGEDDAVRARHGDRPLPALGAAGVLGPGTVVAHAVQLDDADIALLAATGAAVAHCPVSNLNLGCGIAPLPAAAAGRRPGGDRHRRRGLGRGPGHVRRHPDGRAAAQGRDAGPADGGRRAGGPAGHRRGCRRRWGWATGSGR